MKKIRPIRRLTALLLAASLLLGLAACGGEKAAATTMRLRKTEGTVQVNDGKGQDLEAREDLGLYSGYQVDTQTESYAWVDLDSVKLTKLDQETRAEIQKEGKALEIVVQEGNLFFNVTEPLEADESMTIRTSTMAVGIRGTCGWVEVPDDGTMKVFLLEGKVRCEADGEKETVKAGEMAVMTEDGEIVVSEFTAKDVPAFVVEEVEEDGDLAKAILDASGIDVLDPLDPAERLLMEYEAIVASHVIFDYGANRPYTANGITYASEGLDVAILSDLNGDGLDELILLTRSADDGWWDDSPGGCILMEVYGPVMGKATLYDPVSFNEDDYNWPCDSARIVSKDGRPYIYMTCGTPQDAGDEVLWALEDDKLTRVAMAGNYAGDGPADVAYFSDLTEGTYTVLEVPALPADAQQRNAFLSVLVYDASPFGAIFAQLTGEGENMELYALEDEGGYARFDRYTWNSAESALQYTNLETNIRYAKLIDMDQDGREELLLVSADDEGDLHNSNIDAVVYSWEGSEVRKTDLSGGYYGTYSLYRDTVTGDIYLGFANSTMNGFEFSSLTDSVELQRGGLEYDPVEGREYYTEYTIFENGVDRSVGQDEYESQLGRFEWIEGIDLDSYDWAAPLYHTVEEAGQRLRER